MAFLSLLTGRAGLYALIAVGAAIMMAWFHHDIVAPYKQQIANANATIAGLKQAIADNLQIQEADARQAELDRAAQAARDDQLRELTNAANANPSACRFDASALARLRLLAKGNSGPDTDKDTLPKAVSRSVGRGQGKAGR
jgi:type II secretory pathway component PulM